MIHLVVTITNGALNEITDCNPPFSTPRAWGALSNHFESVASREFN